MELVGPIEIKHGEPLCMFTTLWQDQPHWVLHTKDASCLYHALATPPMTLSS